MRLSCGRRDFVAKSVKAAFALQPAFADYREGPLYEDAKALGPTIRLYMLCPLRPLRLGFLARKFLGIYKASPKYASIIFFDLRGAANIAIES